MYTLLPQKLLRVLNNDWTSKLPHHIVTNFSTKRSKLPKYVESHNKLANAVKIGQVREQTKKTHKHEDINQKELVEWQRALMLASNKCCLVENLTGTTQAERRNGASPPGASTCLTSSSGTATPSTSTHCPLQVVSCTCIADICHDRHYRRWCTLFNPVSLLA